MVFESLSTEAGGYNKEFTFQKKSTVQNPFTLNIVDPNIKRSEAEVLTKVSMHKYQITDEEQKSEELQELKLDFKTGDSKSPVVPKVPQKTAK